MSPKVTVEYVRTEKLSPAQLPFFRNLLVSQLATALNVPSGVALRMCRQLHFEFSTKLKEREDCSFQVLNAYDLYYEFQWLLII